MSKLVTVEWCKGRPRAFLRRPTDGGTPPISEPEDTAPMKDAKTGRFVKGNRAYRRRQAKERTKGVMTLNPARCASWLRPHVEDGKSYGLELLGRFADPALGRLVGSTADAFCVYRALLALAAQGDGEALKEARAWLREHRACLRELSALAGLASTDDDTPDPWETRR